MKLHLVMCAVGGALIALTWDHLPASLPLFTIGCGAGIAAISEVVAHRSKEVRSSDQ